MHFPKELTLEQINLLIRLHKKPGKSNSKHAITLEFLGFLSSKDGKLTTTSKSNKLIKSLKQKLL